MSPEQPIVDEHGRREPPPAGDELSLLLGFLNFHRDTLEWKIRGLDNPGRTRPHPPSSMTLAGLVKHLAYVEDHWFVWTLHGEERPEPWASVDWSADVDWDWNSAAHDTEDELMTLWRSSIERSTTAIDRALARGEGLDTLAVRASEDGPRRSLRWILVHMVEEYARHNGHADLLREAVDGQTGE